MSLESLVCGIAGVSEAVVERVDDYWQEVRGFYLRAPFTYRVSTQDEAEAARSIAASLQREWDSGELKPEEAANV